MSLIITDLRTYSNFDIYCAASIFYFSCFFNVSFVLQFYLNLYNNAFLFSLFFYCALLFRCLSFSIDLRTDSNFDIYCAASIFYLSCFFNVSFVLQFYLNLYNNAFLFSLFFLLSALLFRCLSFSINLSCLF